MSPDISERAFRAVLHNGHADDVEAARQVLDAEAVERPLAEEVAGSPDD